MNLPAYVHNVAGVLGTTSIFGKRWNVQLVQNMSKQRIKMSVLFLVSLVRRLFSVERFDMA